MLKFLTTSIAALAMVGFSLGATVAPAEAAIVVHTPGLNLIVGNGHHGGHHHRHRHQVCETHWHHHHRVTVCHSDWQWDD